MMLLFKARQLAIGSVAALALPCFTLAAADMKVLVAPVISAPLLKQLPLSGTITSPKFSTLAARVDGYVEKLVVDVGDNVKAGDPLLELDARLARLELQRLAAAREEADFLFGDAARLAREAKKLAAKKNISQTEFETRIAHASANKARTMQLAAQYAAQQERLARHTLRAPFAGVIAEKLTEAGQWTSAETAAFRLVQLDPLLVEVRVPDRYFGQLQVGSAVTLMANFRSETKIDAAIERIVPVGNTDSRTFLARVKIPNADGALAPGMAVRAEFSLGDGQAAAVLQVPVDALVRRTDGSTLVWVVRTEADASVAQPVQVSIGHSVGDRIEIRSDQLKPGDPVVILGNESLRPGQAVTAAVAG